MATSSNHRVPSRRQVYYHQKWKSIKSDCFQMYKQERKSVKDTLSTIRAKHGFSPSRRTFMNKMIEWGYQKKIKAHEWQWIDAKRERRALEGKDSNFFSGGCLISAAQIENPKRRRTMGGPANVSTPENFSCSTPIPEREATSPEGLHEERIVDSSPQSRSSSLYRHTSSVGTCDSQMSQTEYPQITKFEVPEISMLDRFLDEPDRILWVCSSQSSGRGEILPRLQQARQQFSDILGQSSAETSQSELCGIGNQFWLDLQREEEKHLFIDPFIVHDNEQMNCNAEVKSLQDTIDTEITLAIHQMTHGELAPQTLKQRFELAKIVEKSGNHEEAEYHCRIILDSHPPVEVQAFLGTIHLNASRFQDATFWLFSALTEFIVRFSLFSIKENDLLFPLIEELFTELVRRDDNDWSSLTSCLLEMMMIINEGYSTNAMDLVPAQLFTCGFYFAHECTNLGFIDSAMHIYRRLLEFSPPQSGANRHGIENARAHQRYGRILIQQNNWSSSAEQLELAYKSLVNSKTENRQLIADLETNYVQLMKHQASQGHEESPLAFRLQEFVAHYHRQHLPRRQELSTASQRLPLEQYLSSDDSPYVFSSIVPLAVSDVARFGPCSRWEIEGYTSKKFMGASASHPIADTSSGGSDSMSTNVDHPIANTSSGGSDSMSTNVDHPIATTYSGGSGASMISNMYLMVP